MAGVLILALIAWGIGGARLSAERSGVVATSLSEMSSLLRLGGRVLKCSSGREAIALMRQDPDAVDVVLMDLQMPEMDGCEATLEIRKIAGTAGVPILALTAGATTTEMDRALASGMQDFLVKPLAPADLIRTVRRHVETYRGRPVRFLGRRQ